MTPNCTIHFTVSREVLIVEASVKYEGAKPVIVKMRVLFRDQVDVISTLTDAERITIEGRVLETFVDEQEERRIRIDDVFTILEDT